MLVYTWIASCAWSSVCLFHFLCRKWILDAPPRDLVFFISQNEYKQARSLVEFGAVDKDCKALAVLSSSLDDYRGSFVDVLPLLHALCRKYPKQVDAEAGHSLYSLEQ